MIKCFHNHTYVVKFLTQRLTCVVRATRTLANLFATPTLADVNAVVIYTMVATPTILKILCLRQVQVFLNLLERGCKHRVACAILKMNGYCPTRAFLNELHFKHSCLFLVVIEIVGKDTKNFSFHKIIWKLFR